MVDHQKTSLFYTIELRLVFYNIESDLRVLKTFDAPRLSFIESLLHLARVPSHKNHRDCNKCGQNTKRPTADSQIGLFRGHR